MQMRKSTGDCWISLSRRVHMEKLNLPVIMSPQAKDRSLSMDDYLEFVLFNLEHTRSGSEREQDRHMRKLLSVKVPFSLKA